MHKLILTGYDTNTDNDNMCHRHHGYHVWLNAQQGIDVERIGVNENNYLGDRRLDNEFSANWEKGINRYLTVTERVYAIDDVPSLTRMSGSYPLLSTKSTPICYFLTMGTNVFVTCGSGWEIVSFNSYRNDRLYEYDHIFLIEDDTLAVQFKLAWM